MKTFLQYVAKYIYTHMGNDMAHVAIVFPNKRASLFFNAALINLTDKPFWSPAYVTISDLFREYSPYTLADPITSVAELYKSYVEETGATETLDQFYGWGQLLLTDFDDLDKNMANAHDVFRNLTNLHELDSISYLTDEQKELLNRFFKNFSGDESRLRKRFLELWCKLEDIYNNFRQRLAEKQLAYEGMMYRDVIEHNRLNLDYDYYCFVGFNLLHVAEQKLFHIVKGQGKALFFWDYDSYYLHGKEAGTYISKYLDKFPNALPNGDEDIYNNFTKPKDISLAVASTEDIQARYISTWLRHNNRYKDGNQTAIVLCDENLLQTVLHSLPEQIDGEKLKVNVTMGLPLQQTPITALIMSLLHLQNQGYAYTQQAFRLKYVNAILRHPYARLLSPKAQNLLMQLNASHVYYPDLKQLQADEGLALMFTTFNRAKNQDETNLLMVRWMAEITRQVAIKGKKEKDDLFHESIYRMYTLLNRLADLLSPQEPDGRPELSIDKTTLERLLNMLIRSTNIPFHGEPAVGIQIMGVLETRNLDFKHVLMLSTNEGAMPGGVDDASFLPHNIRKAFGLTTIDNKVDIYSYYFHSLLQRAEDITITYNNSTDGLNTGELSRFVLQLMIELPTPIKRLALQSGDEPLITAPRAVQKTPLVMQRLKNSLKFSPTAINNYIRCELMFFYKYVAGIREPDNKDDDDIDNRVFGNIFHRAAQLMYENLLPSDMITADDIDKLLKGRAGTTMVNAQGKVCTLKGVISQAFAECFFGMPEGTVNHPPLNGLQLINEKVIEKYLRQLLRIDRKLAPFRVIGHELKVSKNIKVGSDVLTIEGRIDRLDQINIGTSAERLRVVDYKTGNRKAKPVDDIAQVFSRSAIGSKHADYILQTMLYSLIESKDDAQNNPRHLPVSPALLFIQHAGADDYSPVLHLGKDEITNIEVLRNDFEEELANLLGKLLDASEPFVPTDTATLCTYCPYAQLCGKNIVKKKN